MCTVGAVLCICCYAQYIYNLYISLAYIYLFIRGFDSCMLPSFSICKSDESLCPVCGKVLLVAKLVSPVVATDIHSNCLSQNLYIDRFHMYWILAVAWCLVCCKYFCPTCGKKLSIFSILSR